MSEERKAYFKAYYLANKVKINEDSKQYQLANQDKVKTYYKANKDKYKEHSKAFLKANTEYFKTYNSKRRQTDNLFKLKGNISNLIRQTLKNNGTIKRSKSELILGCTFAEFKTHLESQFEDWMNWTNYGNWNGTPSELNTSWDIDHIIPISSGLTESELLRLSHYTNLKPLCSYVNRWIKRDSH